MYKNHTKYVREIVAELPIQFTIDDIVATLPKYNCTIDKQNLRYIMCRLRKKGKIKIINKPIINTWHYIYKKLPNQTQLFKEQIWQQTYDNLPEQFTVKSFKDNLCALNPDGKTILIPCRLRALAINKKLDVVEKIKHMVKPAIYEKILQ